MAARSEHKLWVVESNGTPRSGKGTITAGLAETISGSAQDETGADYRAVTFGLMLDELIDPEMDAATIEQIIASLNQSEIASYAAQRYEIVAESGNDALYTPEVNRIVGFVSPFEVVRAAVKDGFSKRVLKHVTNPDTQILFVDGRNLAPVINKIDGAELLLRQFVDCQPLVAAQREALRTGIDLRDPESDAWFRQTRADIRNRQLSDERRAIDPVKPDDNSIDYWFNTSILDETAEKISRARQITFARAAMLLTDKATDFRRDGRHGAGAKAAAENRQVYFDTSEVGKEDMLTYARRMVDEALEQSAGFYRPLNHGLVELTA